jgi:hypothetical protein
MTTTTLAYNIRYIFRQFAGAAGSGERIQVIAAWKRTFAEADTTAGLSVMECIGLVANSLTKLNMQISASGILTSDEKQAAHSVVEGFRACIQPECYLQPLADYQENFSQVKIGYIGLIGHSLRGENPAPDPNPNDLSDIAVQLKELIEALKKAEIPSDLKIILFRHASLMVWAVENLNMVGAQGLYEAIANTMITASRIEQRETNTAAQGDRSSSHIVAKLKDIAQKTLGVLRFADQSVQAFESLKHDLGPLLPGS